MNILNYTLSIALLLGTSTAVAAEPPPASQASRTESGITDTIVSKTMEFSHTWNTGDINRYIGSYEQTGDFALYYSGGQNLGIESARELYLTTWPTKQAMGEFEVFNVTARILSPTTALSHGLFQHRFPDKTVDGNFTLVWRLRDDGDWEIAHEHSARIRVEKRN
ncbi:YybH family protein [Parahaliea aestuarii]|uniref:Nuclear transport factor 2 family protein n=1 Tax=Parahaliea aestuarii TaxID=1852021 RepID=A0A5C8ZS20_9GAMM|nr:hypothetical protein [Parahaliea aestuarii]TXS90594.1 hypothetical protein FVW59_14770 [Parahaliea aestuarii]